MTTDVRQFVALAVENYSRLAPSYVAAMGVALQAAWRETEQWFAIAEEQILALTDDQLAAHDLAGATLEVKLEAVQLATGQAIEVLRNPSPLPESRWKWLRKKFKWTADGIDNVLDSLEPLVPIVGPIQRGILLLPSANLLPPALRNPA